MGDDLDVYKRQLVEDREVVVDNKLKLALQPVVRAHLEGLLVICLLYTSMIIMTWRAGIFQDLARALM